MCVRRTGVGLSGLPPTSCSMIGDTTCAGECVGDTQGHTARHTAR